MLFENVVQGRGWSGGAMVLGKLPVPGRLTNFDYSNARPLTEGAGGCCFEIFTPYLSFLLLIETEVLSQRVVKPKSTNQPTIVQVITVMHWHRT